MVFRNRVWLITLIKATQIAVQNRQTVIQKPLTGWLTMLHDPGHIEAPVQAEEIKFSQKDKDILRRLVEQKAEIAALPAQQKNIDLWTSVNNLKSKRPTVLIYQVCWHEFKKINDLKLQCEHPFAGFLEDELRKTIYQWHHFPGDMVVPDFMACPKAIHGTDFGIVEKVDTIKQDENSDIMSRHFQIQIKEPEDIEKIKMPIITHNTQATQYRFQAMQETFGDILPVREYGQGHIWFTPWDFLVRWWGVTEAMMDLALRPDMVHTAVDRMVDAWMIELDQLDEQNLLELDNNHELVGSGGYGYCNELPGEDFDPNHVKPKNMWGCSNAQVFSEVSPQMHWDFGIEHDLRWLERFKLNYYGCCEQLHHKTHLLRKIPNLRKVSVSPWCDIEKIINDLGSEYVLSVKPSPAYFAEETWDADRVRKNIRETLNIANGKCHLEFILKDISTISYKPERLFDWNRILMEEVQS